MVDHCPLPNNEWGPWASASEDWIWGGIQGSATLCPLCQARIQLSAHDYNMPTLEALIGVPQNHSEGPIMHTWSVQMVSAAQRRKGFLVCGAELIKGYGEGIRMDESCHTK